MVSRKFFGLVVCLMLVATSLMVTKFDPKNSVSKAVAVPEGLDYDYLWEVLGNLTNVIYDAYNQTDIPKGRNFDSKGGIYTANEILVPRLETMFGQGNVKTERLAYINEAHRNYSCIINDTDFHLSVNTDPGAPTYPFMNPISRKEIGYIPYKNTIEASKDNAASRSENWTKHYVFDNTKIVPFELGKLFGGRGSYTVREFGKLTDYIFKVIFGIVHYIGPDDPCPPDYMIDRVFLIDDLPGAQAKLDTITDATAVIIVDYNDQGIEYITDTSNCCYPVLWIDNESGNEVKERLSSYPVVLVDNFGDFMTDLTFRYDFLGIYPAYQPFVLLCRIPDHSELLNVTWYSHPLYKTIALGETLVNFPTHQDEAIHAKVSFAHVLFAATLVTQFFNFINCPALNCTAVILYDSHDYHFVVDQNTEKNSTYMLPILTLNYTAGDFLSENHDTTTLTGDARQDYLEETPGHPGTIGDDVYANISIPGGSPGNAVGIFSNRYDGMWGQTPGDSGVGCAIVLTIAKYVKDHPSIKPKYNLTFLFTTAEEHGFQGARHYVDNHSGSLGNTLVHWLILDQLGFNQKNCGVSIFTTEKEREKTLDTIRKESGYSNYDCWVRAGSGFGSEQGTVNATFPQANTTCLFKGDSVVGKNIFGKPKYIGYSWDQWHRAGDNYTDGDSMQYIDHSDVVASTELIWDIFKYYMLNPDCEFDGPVTFNVVDIDQDGKDDSIQATLTVTSTLPSDKVRIKASLLNDDCQDVTWKYFDFEATSDGVQKTITMTLPPVNGVNAGWYKLHLELYNSSGRIDNIIRDETSRPNDIATQVPFVHLDKRSNVDPNKPGDITGPTTVHAGEKATFSSTGTDDDEGDPLQYQWYWNYEWTNDNDRVGPIVEDHPCDASHVYHWAGSRTIVVRAREDFKGYLFDGAMPGVSRYGNWSVFSDPFTVTVKFSLDLLMSCSAAASAQSVLGATSMPSVVGIDSIYAAQVAGAIAPVDYEWTINNELIPHHEQTLVHHFERAGDDNVVRLRVSDANNYIEEISVNVSVMPLNVSYNLSVPNYPYVNPDYPIVFNDTSAACDGLHITDWTWNFGDGNITNGRNVTHFYENVGQYNVTLTVTDDTHQLHSITKQLNITFEMTPPKITYLDVTPEVVGVGMNASIAAVIADNDSGINTAWVNITAPDNSTAEYPMTHIINDSYFLTFSDTQQSGEYRGRVWAVDNANNTNYSNEFNFTVTPTPIIYFVPPTPPDNAMINQSWAQVNATVEDGLQTAAFIDWNRTLRGYWPMDDYNDTSVIDDSTYHNNGVFWGGLGPSDIVTGKFGKALDFDGIDDAVHCGKDPSLNLGTGDFTFMTWVNVPVSFEPPSIRIILSNQPEATGQGYYCGISNSYARIFTSQGSLPGQTTSLTGTIPITAEAWHHIAYVRQGTELRLYVDGEFDQSTTGTVRDITNNQETCLSEENTAEYHHFRGLLDEPQLYARALSWEEIQASYNNSVHKLAHTFTGLSGTYTFSAHAIDIQGNQSSTETHHATFDADGPYITSVLVTPSLSGFGSQIHIQATIMDNISGVKAATAAIQLPNQSQQMKETQIPMTLVTGVPNRYECYFNDTWLTGRYPVSVRAVDNLGNEQTATGFYFDIAAHATLSVGTLKTSYTKGEVIELTDAFPEVDPSITLYSQATDGYIYNSNTNYNTAWTSTRGTVDNTGASILIGQKFNPPFGPYSLYRGFLFFDTTRIPSNAIIDAATLGLYKMGDYSTTDFLITVQNGQPTYPHNPLIVTDYDKSLYSGNGGQFNTNNFVNGFNDLSLNSQGLGWINRIGVTKLCLRSSRDISGTTPTGNEYVAISSYEFQGIGCQPRLVVQCRNQSKIKNTGITDIRGYLLIQVEFQDPRTGQWMLDTKAVDEQTPRLIQSGGLLALDSIFHGLVKTDDLRHGNGQYRVYAAFCDQQGNVLIDSDQHHLVSAFVFSVSGL